MKWMLGFLLALGVANLWLLVRLAAGGLRDDRQHTLRHEGQDLATKADIIQYRISLGTEDLVASPRGFEPLLPP